MLFQAFCRQLENESLPIFNLTATIICMVYLYIYGKNAINAEDFVPVNGAKHPSKQTKSKSTARIWIIFNAARKESEAKA